MLFLTKLAATRMEDILETLQELNEAIAEDGNFISEMIPELECYSDQLNKLAEETLNSCREDSEDSVKMLYKNHYRCDCGAEWTDEWDCMCNDHCPDCDAEIEPYKSEDI